MSEREKERAAVTLDRWIFEWFNNLDPKEMQVCLEAYDHRAIEQGQHIKETTNAD